MMNLVYLKRTNLRVYLISRVEKNCISRVLIFANGRLEEISRVLIFAKGEKRNIFLMLKKNIFLMLKKKERHKTPFY